MFERRLFSRAPVDLFFNKFVGDEPYLCRAVDLSPRGLRAVTFSAPEGGPDAFPLELRLPGQSESMWLWGRRVRRSEAEEAVELVGLDPRERAAIRHWLDAGPSALRSKASAR